MSDQFTREGATRVVVGIFCWELLRRFNLGVSSAIASAVSSSPLPVGDGTGSSIACREWLIGLQKGPQILQCGGKSMHSGRTGGLDCCSYWMHQEN